ncbi:hypothetical protein MMC34_006620 [Xylographa carneopallida]|nr:hypothetical protein [Xylographa carneopallida]
MRISAPLILFVLSLFTSITASSLPNHNLHTRDDSAKALEVPPSTTSPAPTPAAAPLPGAGPVSPPEAAPPPEAAQNNGGDAASADDNSDSGVDGGLDERDLEAREAYAEEADTMYVRDE